MGDGAVPRSASPRHVVSSTTRHAQRSGGVSGGAASSETRAPSRRIVWADQGLLPWDRVAWRMEEDREDDSRGAVGEPEVLDEVGTASRGALGWENLGKAWAVDSDDPSHEAGGGVRGAQCLKWEFRELDFRSSNVWLALTHEVPPLNMVKWNQISREEEEKRVHSLALERCDGYRVGVVTTRRSAVSRGC